MLRAVNRGPRTCRCGWLSPNGRYVKWEGYFVRTPSSLLLLPTAMFGPGRVRTSARPCSPVANAVASVERRRDRSAEPADESRGSVPTLSKGSTGVKRFERGRGVVGAFRRRVPRDIGSSPALGLVEIGVRERTRRDRSAGGDSCESRSVRPSGEGDAKYWGCRPQL